MGKLWALFRQHLTSASFSQSEGITSVLRSPGENMPVQKALFFKFNLLIDRLFDINAFQLLSLF